jgi:flagellar biosynthesis/type III secretory pathway protein FliH
MTIRRKQRSPSKDRYAEAHPAITVHFNLETFRRLVALREATGLSINELVRAALDSLEAEVATILERGRREGVAQGTMIGEAAGHKAGYAEGFKAGYLKAKAAYRLTYPCAHCGTRIEVRAGDEDAKHAVEVLVEDGWGHAHCAAV